jgi:hypothetical protein
MNAGFTQTSTDFDAQTMRQVTALNDAENSYMKEMLDKATPEMSEIERETQDVMSTLMARIRTIITKIMISRLEKNDHKVALLDQSDSATVAVTVIGNVDSDEERDSLLAMVKPLTETIIKSMLADLRYDPYEGDLYDKAFARIRAYLEIARNHSGLTSAELATSAAIRAEYMRLVETPKSWDTKIARAFRELRRMHANNILDPSLAPHLEGQLGTEDERQAAFSDSIRDSTKRLKPIYAARKAEIWPEAE